MFDDKGLELHECKDQYAIKEYVKVNITVTDANNTTVLFENNKYYLQSYCLYKLSYHQMLCMVIF
ncbi:hypothetical protein pb186bvf_008183 [Paramecium bursaria]